MFLQRLAAGLVFLAGVVLSRVGIGIESWPVLSLGLIAATLGLWHFFMGGTAASASTGPRHRPADVGPADGAPAEPVPARH